MKQTILILVEVAPYWDVNEDIYRECRNLVEVEVAPYWNVNVDCADTPKYSSS